LPPLSHRNPMRVSSEPRTQSAFYHSGVEFS
jgi:hypothetical protein